MRANNLQPKVGLGTVSSSIGLPPIQSIIDACPTNIAIIDNKGIIRYVNAGWRRVAKQHGTHDGSYGAGAKYLDLCWESGRRGISRASVLARGIQRLFKSRSQTLTDLHRCQMFSTGQWFEVRGSRFVESGPSKGLRVLLIHEKVKATDQTVRAIQERDERLKEWVESAPFVPWEADAKTLRMTYVGPQVQKLLGFPQEDWYKPDFWFDHLHPEDRARIASRYQALGNTPARSELQYRMIANDGRVVWIRDTVAVVGKARSSKILRGFFSDVSSEAYLRERETLLRLLSESIDEIFWFVSVNPDRLIYISSAVEQIMGYKVEQFYRDVDFWIRCVHEEDRSRVEEAYTAWLSGAASEYKLQFRIVLPDGRVRWLADHGALIHGHDGRISFATGIAKDITEQRQTEDALRRLSAQLISAQEGERRRISRELHDHVSQTLALLSVELEQVSRDGDMTPNQQGLLAAMQGRVRALSSDIHTLSHELHPPKLKHLGLVAAIRALCRDVGTAGLRVEFTDHDVPRDLPEDVALTIYRIMQEGLQNVRKHSGTSRAQAELTRCSTGVVLRVRDEGKGFHAGSADATEGLGLLSMRERLNAVGGALAIMSAPGEGTAIEAYVPLP
ncbi:MAG TPA: PAS domain-containing protein [Nitrospira sp.]|nr:PAS domain-containing protein [Nitrospira sp.]